MNTQDKQIYVRGEVSKERLAARQASERGE